MGNRSTNGFPVLSNTIRKRKVLFIALSFHFTYALAENILEWLEFWSEKTKIK